MLIGSSIFHFARSCTSQFDGLLFVQAPNGILIGLMALQFLVALYLYRIFRRRTSRLTVENLRAKERINELELLAEVRLRTVEVADTEGINVCQVAEVPEAETINGFQLISEAQREAIALQEIALTIGRSLDLEDTFELIAFKLRTVAAFDTCVIHFVDELFTETHPAHVSGFDEDYFCRRNFRIGEGVTGWVIANSRAMHSAAPELELADAPEPLKTRIRSVMAAPLIRDGAAFGAITLYSAEHEAGASEHLRLLEAVTVFASNAINNSLTYQKTRENALADPLTGLPNQRATLLTLEQRLAECQRQPNAALSVLSLNIDDFKRVNDEFGHGVGDRLINEISLVIKAQLRQMDTLARSEGDDFIAVMPTANADAAAFVAERVRAAVESHSFSIHAGKSLQVGISVGLACFPDHGETAEHLLTSAHSDMLRAKQARRLASQVSCAAGVVSLDSYR